MSLAIVFAWWSAFSPQLARPEPAPPVASEPARESVSVRTAPRPSVPRFTLAVEDRPLWRSLRYRDDVARVLRGYDLAANAIGASAIARPLAGAPGLHVTLAGELVIGVGGSRTSDGAEYGTAASEWSIGAGYAARIGGLTVGATAGFGEHRFHVDDDAMLAPGDRELVPDMDYRWLRLGLDAERRVSRRVTATAHAGWRHLLRIGDLDSAAWFPRGHGAGIDAALGLDLRLSRRVTAYARVDLRRYFFTMDPQVGDALVAGGAVDQYLGGAIGAAVAIP